MVDSFGKIRRLFNMFHGVRIPKSTLNHFCDKAASELVPLYQEIKRDLNTGRLVKIRQKLVTVGGKIMFGTIMTCLLTWDKMGLNWFEKLSEAFWAT